ncbi:hypothetical protein NHX12_008667 [Muraenolepis orangiensis]|uniref:Chordin n=1 Tax=Muraenolepis orangiensis TaxID=630683 RepID=A0A9Q0DNI3_9TELE|nr:hypothetical protein NHX12_008667 [Muraenolepis orangiensis]
MSSGDALTPGKTGGVGSAIFNLHDNGTLDYQVQVAGLSGAVVGLTIELKPRRRHKRSVLYDLTAEMDGALGRALGSWSRLEARHIHMLLHNELFINVATEHSPEGELRELPNPLAGQLVAPPVRTGAGGHAWVSVDERCHLHYEIVVAGLGKGEDQAARGVLKDLSSELLQHLDRGTVFLQVSTKLNPRGEIRGRELKKDPNTCFFESQHRAHSSRWTPNYDKCFSCSCQKKTVICDPVICPVLTCARTLQPEDKCCPVCDERKEPKDTKVPEKLEEHPEGCYFEGDQKMHAPGTTWHPFVPPFGYIKCAVCTCKGSTGEVHCEKVTCPALTCGRPHADMMQADGTLHCKFGKSFYQNSDSWHPRVPLVGEMKCINCWCDHGVTKCQRKQCPVLTCHNITRKDDHCCPECLGKTRTHAHTHTRTHAHTHTFPGCIDSDPILMIVLLWSVPL